jgi:succinate dehydrogenase / fumarate reductase cytochrome b subunit
MATSVSAAADREEISSASTIKPGVAPLRAGQGHDFLLRRLHSLTGIVPVGAFLLEHILISNATAMSGPVAYAVQVKFLGSLPLVFYLELLGIWLPILFHGLYGFYLWHRGEMNLVHYPWAGNWLYNVQRWTGAIAFAYIVVHVYTLRFTGVDLHENPAAAFGKVQAELADRAYLAFYVLGLVAASWHLAYGIWLFLCKWGIVTGEQARRRALRLSLGLFLLLTVVGLGSLRSFVKHERMPVDGATMDRLR